MSRSLLVAAALFACAACSPDAPPSSHDERPAVATEPSPVLPPDSAIALYEKKTTDDPRDHLSATMLAELHLRRAEESLDAVEFAAAEKAARTALERQPDHPAAIVALARAVAGQGHAAEARKMLDGLLDREPRNVPALGAAFDLAFVANDEHIAESLADRLLAINEEPGTLSRMALVAERHGDVDRAVTLLRRARKDAEDLGALPDELSRYRRLAGWALLRAKRLDEAAREFDAALAVDPRNADAWRGRAEILAARGDSAGAVAAMTKAVAIRPTPDFRARLDTLRTPGGGK